MGHATATLDEITLRRKAAAAKAVATRRARCTENRSSQPVNIQLPQIKLAADPHGRCENCGLPPGARSTPGYFVQVTRKAENAFHRDSKATVWVCSRECGVQALAVSAYGVATSRWPVSLDQFRATVSSMFARKAADLYINQPPARGRGALHVKAYWDGFDGRPNTFPRTSYGWWAYKAGKDAARKAVAS